MIGLSASIYNRVKLIAIVMSGLVWAALLYLIFTRNSELPRWYGLTLFFGFVPYILCNVLFQEVEENEQHMDTQADSKLNADQVKAVENLTKNEVDEIDRILFQYTNNKWQKIAYVVASAMKELTIHHKGIPDLYFAQRVRRMVADGTLESQGLLENMRYSEVRRVKL
jgi:hypothetical protein